MKFLFRLLVFAACAALGPLAAGQPFPGKPIRMIAPSSPGGPVDVIARVLVLGMTETLGQQVVVENRAGAAGLIGAERCCWVSPGRS
jgi:tripartite-type tricarboxylate transporter receptor subunit TctC